MMQGTAGYDSDDASGYSYQSTPYVYEGGDSPVIRMRKKRVSQKSWRRR